MPKTRFFVLIAATSFVASLGVADVAVAQKKVSYAEAFKACKAELDQSGAVGASLSVQARTSAGAGCMQKYGYRLKKKSKM